MTSDADAPPPRVGWRLGVGAAVVLVILALAVTVGIGILRGASVPTETVVIDDEPGGVTTAVTYVHVAGAVAAPGLYVLGADARLVDAIAAAGGFAADADRAAVNLARPLSDGEQLYVPTVGETATSGGIGSGVAGDGRVDLNTATAAELEALPRIGPALAERIVAWRDVNGRFTSVDDLLAVSGIGAKVLDSLRDLVRV